MKYAMIAAILTAAALTGCSNDNGSQSMELLGPDPAPPMMDDSPVELTDDGRIPPPPTDGPLYTPPSYQAPAQPTYSNTPPAAPAAQRTHVVRAGETLWRISAMYYDRPSRENVERIVQANPGISDPNRISAGQTIVIPQ